MNELILTFLKSGKLGELTLGLSLKEAEAIVGPPGKCERPASRCRTVWEMDDLTLSFFEGKLDTISLRCKGDELNIFYPSLERKGIALGYKTYEEFVDFLSENQIEYSPLPSETYENLTCIRLTSGGRVYFESKRLDAIVMM